jgi:hypothetical protein
MKPATPTRHDSAFFPGSERSLRHCPIWLDTTSPYPHRRPCPVPAPWWLGVRPYVDAKMAVKVPRILDVNELVAETTLHVSCQAIWRYLQIL